MTTVIDSTRTGRQLATLLSSYLLLIIAVITLAPFQLRWPVNPMFRLIVLGDDSLADVVLNVVLFVPVGLVLRRGWSGGDRWSLRVFVAGALISACIETTQLFIPARYSTFSDIGANALGAWCGALVSDLVSNRIGEGLALVGRLRLDVPLMGLVYLLLPLLWLSGLTSSGNAGAIWPILPLAIAGTLALSAVSEQRPIACAITAVGWFLIGSVPLWRTAPQSAEVTIPVVMIVALAGRVWWARVLQRDRRLEPQVVRIVLPILILHLLLRGGVLDPLTLAGGAESARLEILRWVARFAAFTILGYLIAEARGRRLERLAILVIQPALAAVIVELLLALAWQNWGGIVRFLLPLTAAMLGATLYHLQRSHIRALLGLPPDGAAAPSFGVPELSR